MAEPRLVELQNMRVLLEEMRVLARNLAYHRRAKLEAALGRAQCRGLENTPNSWSLTITATL